MRFVVPLRADTGWAAPVRRRRRPAGGLAALEPLDYVSCRERRLPPGQRTTWKGLLRPFPVTTDDTGAPTTCGPPTSGPARKPPRSPTPASAPWPRPRTALTRIRNGLGGRYYKTSKQVDARVAQILTGPVKDLITVRTGTKAGKPWITWARNQDAITAAIPLDGLYALATNLPDPRDGAPLTALDVLKIYKDQWIVEQRHRDLKQTLQVRPVFLHNDDRIHALIAVIGIALLIFGLIEAELRAALGPDVPLPGILPEGRAAKPTARAVLAAFDRLHATYTTSRHRPRPPHPRPADHPRPARHPAALARNAHHHNNIQESRP